MQKGTSVVTQLVIAAVVVGALAFVSGLAVVLLVGTRVTGGLRERPEESLC
ncbi:MAG TPA: hypothetical protein VGD55_08180 [Acidothermaceae bacterium]